MSERLVAVNMAQLAVSKEPEEVLIALGLGSCIAVCVYDPAEKIAGMIHVVLPSSAIARDNDTPAKFADTGVPKLLETMIKAGARRSRLKFVIGGGANVLNGGVNNGILDVGQRNIAAVKQALEKAEFSLQAEDVGGNYSRTLRLKVASGEVTLKTFREGERRLAELSNGYGH
jgi:chemotaxis protein CheD